MKKKELIERWKNTEGLNRRSKIIDFLNGQLDISEFDKSYFNEEYLDLRGFIFEENMIFSNISYDKIDFSYVDFNDARFENCDFSNSLFISADMTYVVMWQSNIINSTFKSCKIKGSIGIWGGKYTNLIFEKVDFRGVIIGYPDFGNCIFNHCKLDKVDFSGSDFINVKFIGDLKDIYFRGTKDPVITPYENFDIKRSQKINSMKIDFSEAKFFYPNFKDNCDLSKVILPKDGKHYLIRDVKEIKNTLLELMKSVDDKTSKYYDFLIDTKLNIGQDQNMLIINYDELLKSALKYLSDEEEFKEKFIKLIK